MELCCQEYISRDKDKEFSDNLAVFSFGFHHLPFAVLEQASDASTVDILCTIYHTSNDAVTTFCDTIVVALFDASCNAHRKTNNISIARIICSKIQF